MAHELTYTHGKYEMAYAGETPWHGLGQEVTVGASIGVWQKEAGMNWTAVATPVEGWSQPEGPTTIRFPGYKGLYRDDTNEPLAIVGEGYQVVQPKEVLEFFRDLVEVGGWHIHTAGTLRGGRKLWAMASQGAVGVVNPRAKDVRQRDPIRNNLLLATSLDGSMRTTAMLTSVRVVCANTLALALGDTGENSVRVSHRSIFDPSAIKHALGVAPAAFELFMEQARTMAEMPVSLDQARKCLAEIFGQGKVKADSSWLMGSVADYKATAKEPEVKDSRSVSRILELFQGEGMGSDLVTAQGTQWGLLNAVTQYVDHEMGRTPDTRLDAAWFGRGQQFKQQAFNEISFIA
jgi:phage/plasmid-like protein (TIGR03299 family)